MLMGTYDVLRSFEDISALFKVLYFEPLWRKYNLNDSMDAASLFLEGYAFERRDAALLSRLLQLKLLGNLKEQKDLMISR